MTKYVTKQIIGEGFAGLVFYRSVRNMFSYSEEATRKLGQTISLGHWEPKLECYGHKVRILEVVSNSEESVNRVIDHLIGLEGVEEVELSQSYLQAEWNYAMTGKKPEQRAA